MKKTILFGIVLFVLCFFSGCGEKENVANTENTTIIITDSIGREVLVPKVIERIVPLGNTPRMITYLKIADKAVGIGGLPSERITPITAYAYANKELWKDLPHVGTDAGGSRDYYPEQIIAVAPDVIFCTYDKELADEIQMKTGSPVVVVPMGTLFEKDFEEALLMIGEICDVKDRANEVIDYIHSILSDLNERTKDIPLDKKPSIIGAAATYKGVHGIESVYSNYPVFKAIDANDVAIGISDVVTGVMVDKEKIISWDPDFIMLDSGGVPLVQADYKEYPSYYKQLSAFNKDNIYQYPSSTSYYSNVEIPLVNSYYVASLVYPEAFSDIQFEDKANEIFAFFLGKDNYLNELENFGIGYKKVRIGE